MKKRLSALITFLFVLGDLFFLNLSIVLSYQLSSGQFWGKDLPNSLYLLIFSNLAWFFLLLITNPYAVSSATRFSVLIRSHFSFVFIHILVLISLVFFFDKSYALNQIFLVYAIFIPVVFFWRALYSYLINSVVQATYTNINYIIIGADEQAREIRRNFRFHPEYGYKFLGFFEGNATTQDSIDFSRIQTFCLQAGVNEIYCSWPSIQGPVLKKLLDFGLNNFIRVKLVTDSTGLSERGIQLERYEQIPVINIAAIPLDDVRSQVIKRAFDIAFTLVVLITILSWLLPLVTILIKLDSKGPILFKQLRAGKRNKPFMCLKFRTMFLNDQAVFAQATQNDPRITRIGKFLRKTSLDEFPQFLNVLLGEMSIVGPRPHVVSLNDEFALTIRKLMSRHYVKPGITGLAQCLGYRGETKNDTQMKHRITLDRFYVERWSLFFDIRIIFQTVVSLLRGSDKAY